MNMRTKKGFTLIELIICISIIVLVGGILLANYRAGQKQSQLRAETQKLASTLRQAQNMALSGSAYEEDILPHFGYGVYITSDEYFIFANYNFLPYNTATPSTPAYDSERKNIVLERFIKIAKAAETEMLLAQLPPVEYAFEYACPEQNIQMNGTPTYSDSIVERIKLPSSIKIIDDGNLPLVFVFIPPKAFPVNVLPENDEDAKLTSGTFGITLQLGEDETNRTIVSLDAGTGKIDILEPGCGNGICESGEDSTNCCQDCGSVCGDGVCNCEEDSTNCCDDCARCGDGICNCGETCKRVSPTKCTGCCQPKGDCPCVEEY